MATNSGRGNPIAATEGIEETSTAPPNVSSEVKQEIANSTQSAAPGEHASGQDAGVAPAAEGPLKWERKDIIEPIMKPQWWVSTKQLAQAAIQAVREGKIKIRPESAEKSYYRWLEDINDWYISRQLWWGHICPAYFAKIEGDSEGSPEDKLWFIGRTREEAEKKAQAALPGKTFTLEQDEDVLDTWFSSGLWPFSTLGWPEKTPDFEKLFSMSILETGWDILFFWIARMIMLSLKLTGQVPLKEVYCYSLVRDSEGRKMSKSLGNGVEPLDVIAGIKLENWHEKLLQGNLHPSEIQKETYR